mmetsp:Transcript_85858/g.256011  ORF Transcript_85858/g.256011 Transcript_85858/m.256011 type:complete len:251 (+) Transcript_85858:679-1431(+)
MWQGHLQRAGGRVLRQGLQADLRQEGRRGLAHRLRRPEVHGWPVVALRVARRAGEGQQVLPQPRPGRRRLPGGREVPARCSGVGPRQPFEHRVCLPRDSHARERAVDLLERLRPHAPKRPVLWTRGVLQRRRRHVSCLRWQLRLPGRVSPAYGPPQDHAQQRGSGRQQPRERRPHVLRACWGRGLRGECRSAVAGHQPIKGVPARVLTARGLAGQPASLRACGPAFLPARMPARLPSGFPAAPGRFPPAS